MQSSNILKIDLAIIDANLRLLTEKFPQMMMMVKGNAYGTDPLLLTKYLRPEKRKGIAFLGVSHVWEAVQLREAGMESPIFVLSVPPYEAEYVASYGLTASVSTLEEIAQLNQAGKKQEYKVPVHLYLNTGMNRSGASLLEATHVYNAIQKASYLHLDGVMTHFAAAENPSFDSFTQEQIAQFKSFVDTLPVCPRWVHAANSSGAARFQIPFCNLARIGLGVMGYGDCLPGVKPAYRFSTRLASITVRDRGETVGYQRLYTLVREKERIGVIPVGYHDGMHRNLSGKGYVLIRGKKAPMIGLICMDFMMINLTDIPEAEVGDEVILFGEGELTPELIGQWGNSDLRETLANMPRRVERQWLHI